MPPWRLLFFPVYSASRVRLKLSVDLTTPHGLLPVRKIQKVKFGRLFAAVISDREHERRLN